MYERIRKLLEITEGTLLRYGIDTLFLNRRHTMSETGAEIVHTTAGGEHAHEVATRTIDEEKDFAAIDRFSIGGGGGVKLARGESPERFFFFFFLSFYSLLSFSFSFSFHLACHLLSLSRPMRDAITVLQLAHAISSRRCLLPSCLFFWPPEAAPSRPPLPPLPAAILVISGETQLRYFAPDLGFHSIPRPRVEIRGRKTRGQVYEASSSDVVVVAASIARDEDGNGWESMGQEKERGFVRRRGGY